MGFLSIYLSLSLSPLPAEKPMVVGALEDLNYCLEDDVTFTLRASGLPLPECTWKKNGVPVKEDDKHVFSNPEPGVYCLTIKNIDAKDYGEVRKKSFFFY